MKNIVTIFLIAFSGFLFSQNRCGLGWAWEEAMRNASSHVYSDNYTIAESSGYSNHSSVACYTIPVVFHILHLGGPENISDAQVNDALRILNEDFRKLNPDTSLIVPVFKNIAADACIQFSLASLDPNGKCTTGILRYYDSLTFWTSIQLSNYKYIWPSDRYLNIFVVKALPPGVGGYAYLPGTVSSQIDAVVILNSMVGSIGTSGPYSSRALTHEVGHWLGLHHVWGGNNNPGQTCGDDGIGDTPLTKGWSYCELNNNMICTPGVHENVQNYMEYSFCSCMFTQGQVQKMQQVIQSNIAGRGDLVSAQNLSLTGVINPNYNCPPRPDFFVNPDETKVNGSVVLTDMSGYSVPQFYEWKSNRSSVTYTQQSCNMVFSRPGLADIQLKVGNTYGSDSLKKKNVAVVQSVYGGSVNYVYTMESMNWPDSNWVFTTPDIGSSFTITSLAAYTGQKSLFIDNYQDYPSGKISLYLPEFDLSNVPNAGLEFHYAYADIQSGSQGSLKVYARPSSSNASWTLLGDISGNYLSTASLQTGPFYPAGSQEWKHLSFLLSGFSGKVLIKLVFIPDAFGRSNNFFLDDLRVGTLQSLTESGGLAQQCKIYSENAHSRITLQCEDKTEFDFCYISDVTGKIIFSSAVKDNSVSLQLSRGVYITTWMKKDGFLVRKKMILY